MGKLLFVDLSAGESREETPEESLYRDFIGGYGIGARLMYSHQRGGVNPLGPENTLGFITGPLTGAPVSMGARFTVVAKSPLTGGWGDANSGGEFGPHFKFAGYDGVFFTGASEKPVYLLIDNGKIELRNAGDLWGKDTYETEDILRSELGKGTEIVCIGPSGEKLSRISSIITRKGAAAARSGLGAVMGAKKLKAVAARGNLKVPIADSEAVDKLRREHLTALRAAQFRGRPFFNLWHKYGTSNTTEEQALSGDTPVKNWGGIGIIDFPDPSGISADAAIANLGKHEGCWHCPLACEGRLKEGTALYKYPAGTRRPEYETEASFGTMCLNNNQESIAMANHICNSYGLDTISTGSTIAFAIECYENGLITRADTDGIELTWGNHRSIVAMTQKLAKREGFGDILADGVKIAADRIGKGSERFAIHTGGQELIMHDPKLSRFSAVAFSIYRSGPLAVQRNVINASGFCLFGLFALKPAEIGNYLGGFLRAVTGWDRSWEELLKAGERIASMRQSFDLREGINLLEWQIPDRVIGNPPQKEGPLAGMAIDTQALVSKTLDTLEWDRLTTKPSKKKLLELGLNDVAQALWP